MHVHIRYAAVALWCRSCTDGILYIYTFISCILFGMLSRPLFGHFEYRPSIDAIFSSPLSFQVIENTYANFSRLSMQRFFPLYKAFLIWPSKVNDVSDYLIMHCLYDNLGWDALIAWWGSVHHMQFLEGYLHQYKVPRGVRISDPTWKELFSEVVKRWPILYNTWALSTNIDQENFSVKIILQSRPTTKNLTHEK